MILKFWNWIVTSSADANKTSLTVKGFLVGIIPAAMILLHIANINVGQEQLTGFIDAFSVVIQDALTLISAVMFLWGLIRKLSRTVDGTNAALQ